MSVGFIDSSCAQRHAVVSAVLTSLRGSAAPADRSVAESGADTSRGWCGFPPLLVDITRYCGRCLLNGSERCGAKRSRRFLLLTPLPDAPRTSLDMLIILSQRSDADAPRAGQGIRPWRSAPGSKILCLTGTMVTDPTA